MDCCDVLIVGGGPAGSSCAWALRGAGLDVAILDRSTFPRDKVCGGWITLPVLRALSIDIREYGRNRTLQPISSFRVGAIGAQAVALDYSEPVSYGIRRSEFDYFLLDRSGARRWEGESLNTLGRAGDGWIANGRIQTRLVIGAGGHFCPVAKLIGAKSPGEAAVVAQEVEFEMNPSQQAACRVEGKRPELYFCADMKGYGWCFRKNNRLNIGLGRMDSHALSSHVREFIAFLKSSGRVEFEVPPLHGHAYLLFGRSGRKTVGDGYLLIGDSAGLAYPQSGEGIWPAIQSGLLAADAIQAANRTYGRQQLAEYSRLLENRFGKPQADWASAIGSHLPSGVISAVARRLLRTEWFVRDVIIGRWFLNTPGSKAHAAG